MENAAKLLTAAGVLMLLAGAIFGLLGHWIYTAPICAGAFGCLIAALNFKGWKGK